MADELPHISTAQAANHPEPQSTEAGKRPFRLKQFLLGSPLPTYRLQHERLPKTLGLAVFSSDALSSVAYATEEILLVLIAVGAAALSISWPIALAITGLLVIVATSYYQTIHAYPSGGGAYIVVKENLGERASLVAGAALMLDYILTVSVSIAAGVAAITSAFPALLPERVWFCLLAILIMTLINLRGVKESGLIFAIPTYFFVAFAFLMLITGFVKLLLYGAPPHDLPVVSHVTQPLTWFLILRAFASGCTALTGVEAIADGVPVFRPPESKNASLTLCGMVAILASMFLGITFLANHYGVWPHEGETVVSQLARDIFGNGIFYYLLQAATVLILLMAANTSYADFPRLASFLARDGFLPRQMVNLGDRLVFSNGVVILGVLSALLIIFFNASTHALIPLYAVGVFLSFTLSQTSMVRRWLTLRPSGWPRRIVINSIGAVTTGAVLLVVTTTKFTHGAWVVLVLLPTLVILFRKVRFHYRVVAAQVALKDMRLPAAFSTHTVIVPVSGLYRQLIPAWRYAQLLSKDVRVVYVNLNPQVTAEFQAMWKSAGYDHIPLVILESPYRSIVQPLMDYIEHVQSAQPDHIITVVLPEFVPAKWWQHALHNQTALQIKGALLFARGVVVTSVPYHLRH